MTLRATLLGVALVVCLAQPHRLRAQTTDDYWRVLRAQYYRGASSLSDVGREEYTRYLAPLLTAEELEEWRTTPDDRAADWLRAYWARSAASSGVLPDERVAEHYRRMHRAHVDFPSVGLSSLNMLAQFILGEDIRRFGLGLKGTMLVRHGDPDRLAVVEQCLSNPWPTSGTSGTICAELGGDRLAVFREMARLARGDSYFPFTRALDFYWGVYAFRGAGGTNDVVFSVGVPTLSANAFIESGRLRGTISSVLLADSGDFIRSDSAFDMSVPRYIDPLAGETEAVVMLFDVLEVPAVDAEREFRVTISDVERHAGGIGSGRVATRDFSAFSVSDVVIAPATMPSGWSRGAATVRFAPLATYRPGETVAVYYEVYGLDDGAAYETEIEIAPPTEGVTERLLDLVRDRSIRFRFTGTATDPHPVHGVQEDRTLRLDGVEPGIWTLTVRVTDTSGRVAEREALIEIED